jgi:DNA-binding MarR family transcriptional regulator
VAVQHSVGLTPRARSCSPGVGTDIPWLSTMGDDRDIEVLEKALLAFLAAYRRSHARLQQDPDRVGLTNAQFAILETVATHGASGVGAIATAAGLAQPSATRALARLHSKGLLERQSTPDNARVTAVVVTPRGKDLLAAHRQRLRQTVKTLHDGLSPVTRAAVVPVLALLGDALDELL